MNAFVDVVRLADIPVGAGLAVEMGANRVALFHVDGEVFATDNACIRCAGELASGRLHGHDVECPQCGWRYDVVTGRVHGVPKLRLDTFAVCVSGANVMLRN